MDVTEDGIVTEDKDVQPLNALSPMDVTEDGIVTEVKETQSSNALLPMKLTDEGITATFIPEIKSESPLEASLPI